MTKQINFKRIKNVWNDMKFVLDNSNLKKNLNLNFYKMHFAVSRTSSVLKDRKPYQPIMRLTQDLGSVVQQARTRGHEEGTG